MKNIFNTHSIFFTINIVFFISIVVVILSFGILYEATKNKQHHLLKKRSVNISKMILREQHKNGFPFDAEFMHYLMQLNYKFIQNPQIKKNILQSLNSQPIFVKRLRNNDMILYQKDKIQIMVLKTPFEEFVIEDTNEIENDHTWLIFVFLLVIIILSLLYFIIVQKLKPLQTLHRNIKKLSKEEYDIHCISSKKDEISLVSNELHRTVLKLKKIKESRNIFIRNIMHELKTPITKGRLLSELEQTEKNKQKLQRVFLRLEALIGEFASIEELISTKKELVRKDYFLDDIIDEAIDLLMIDPQCVCKQYEENIKLTIDFHLFSIALKNLIDNGIKYANDNKITITNTEDEIIFTNQGKPLKYTLEQYYEPFFKGDNVKSNESFGLGLYIVHHILQAHDYKLKYNYANGLNNFILFAS